MLVDGRHHVVMAHAAPVRVIVTGGKTQVQGGCRRAGRAYVALGGQELRVAAQRAQTRFIRVTFSAKDATFAGIEPP